MAEEQRPAEDSVANRRSGSGGTAFAGIAALGSLIAAASCCIPVLPFLFAAGAAGASTLMSALQPYLLVVSVLLIAYGFYSARRAKQCNRKTSAVSAALLWFSAMVVFASIFFPQVTANLIANLLRGK